MTATPEPVRPGSAHAPHSTGYVELLRRNRRFRLLFIARSVSLLGDWFNTIAVFALLDQIYGRNAQAFGWVLILKLAPLFVMGPAAGVVADRFSRKAVMIWTDLLRVVVVTAFLGLALWPRLEILFALTALQVGLAAFFEPARTALVSQICDADELVAANALMAVTWSIMLTLGAAIGGLASHAFGWQVAIVLDALTYLISALIILPVALPGHEPRERLSGLWHTLGMGDAVDGFRFMWRSPAVATMVWAKGAWGVGGSLTLMLTVFGQRIYSVAGSAVLGMTLFYAARGLGTALGPIVSRRLTRSEPAAMSLAVGASFGVAALFYMAFGFVQNLVLAVLFVILAHLGGATIWVFSTVLIQRSVPHSYQGRVFAAEMALFTLTFSISTWVYGHLLDVKGFDPHLLMRILALSILVSGALWSIAARVWPLQGRRAGLPETGNLEDQTSEGMGAAD